jgi:hypothetical protein
LYPIVGRFVFDNISEKCKKLRMVRQELGESAVEFNCRVLRIDFRAAYPSQVDNCETVLHVSMAEQNVIVALRITERLHRQAKKQMSPRQLAFKLCQKALGYAGIWPLPILGETVRI